jgi:hypothetical protein
MIPIDERDDSLDNRLERALSALSDDGAPSPGDDVRMTRAIRRALAGRPPRRRIFPLALCAALLLCGLVAFGAELAQLRSEPAFTTGSTAIPSPEIPRVKEEPVPSAAVPRAEVVQEPVFRSEATAPAFERKAASPPPSSPDGVRTAPSSSPPTERLTAAELFSRANAARRVTDLTKAASLYAELEARFPEAPEAGLSKVSLGRLQLDQLSEPAKALEQFDSYLAKAGPLAEEAMVGRAQALGRLSRRTEERAAWAALLAKYPDSVWARTARERSSLP